MAPQFFGLFMARRTSSSVTYAKFMAVIVAWQHSTQHVMRVTPRFHPNIILIPLRKIAPSGRSVRILWVIWKCSTGSSRIFRDASFRLFKPFIRKQTLWQFNLPAATALQYPGNWSTDISGYSRQIYLTDWFWEDLVYPKAPFPKIL